MKRILSTVLGLSLFAAGCSDPVPPTAPTPVTPTITEVFTDTLGLLGGNTHLFSVQQVGGLKLKVSDVNPDVGLILGFGTQTLGGCSVFRQLTREAGSPAELSGTVTAPGNFCISVLDAGALIEPVTYTITVLHS